jgi:hypothetical protein
MDTIHYSMPSAQRKTASRYWYLDALSALAFLGMGLFLLRPLKSIPALAFIVVFFNLGMAYFFGRAALRGLLKIREKG